VASLRGHAPAYLGACVAHDGTALVRLEALTSTEKAIRARDREDLYDPRKMDGVAVEAQRSHTTGRSFLAERHGSTVQRDLSNLLLGQAAFRGRDREPFESRMREMRLSGSISGNRKQR
jgi:hypothetical protein